MAILSQNVSVSSTAVPLYHHSYTSPTVVTVLNTDPSIDLLVGDSLLTRSNYGHRVAKNGGEHDIPINYGETIYGITDSGTTAINVHVFATGWDGQ